MFKNFMMKIAFLVIGLAVVLAIITTTMHLGSKNTTTETEHTQTFFEQFVVSGGPIVWFVLLPMSLITAYLMAEYSLTIRRKKLLPEGTSQEIVKIIQRSGPIQLESQIANRDDLVSIAVAEAVAKGKADWFRMRSILAESLQEQTSRLLRKIEWLNLIGNVSPMVGLFGTVFGMIKLFNAIVIAGGQPQPVQLANGISIALVTTFWGLFIAIPALAIHGVFRNKIETLVSDAVIETENIVPHIRVGLKKQNQIKQQSKQKLPICELPAKPTGSIAQSLPYNNRIKQK